MAHGYATTYGPDGDWLMEAVLVKAPTADQLLDGGGDER
jgi:hypothetical protein